MTEAKAMKELKKDSEEALGWFIDRYTPYVTTIIHNVLGAYMDASDIEEVAADVFFALWENAEKVHSPKGYLGTVARNMAKNKLRQLGDTVSLDENILVLEGISPETALEEKELSRAVKGAVLDMGHPDREIFLRFYYYFQSLEEIATEMDMNLSTVKTRLRRGRARLKETLTRYIT